MGSTPQWSWALQKSVRTVHPTFSSDSSSLCCPCLMVYWIQAQQLVFTPAVFIIGSIPLLLLHPKSVTQHTTFFSLSVLTCKFDTTCLRTFTTDENFKHRRQDSGKSPETSNRRSPPSLFQACLLYCTLPFFFSFLFYKLKVCGNPVWSQSISASFPTKFTHSMSVTIQEFSQYLKLFHYYHICNGNL